MATTTRTRARADRRPDMNRRRDHEIRQMLESSRRELMHEVHGRIRDVRADGAKDRQVLDLGESSEGDIQGGIEFALIEMKAETLNQVDAALRRLSENTYGVCVECGDEIADQRLRALRFAVRCRDCEEAHELAALREHVMARRGPSSSVVKLPS